MQDSRFEQISDLFINYALGNFDFKVAPSSKLDEIDAFISNINMLGEELKSTTISKNYFNDIFNSVSDMLFVLNEKGIIENANKMVSGKLGFETEELIGMPFQKLAAYFDPTHLKIFKKKLMKGNVASEFESVLAGKDGNTIPVFCTYNILNVQSKENKNFLLIARDLTTIKKYEKSLIQSEEKYRKVFHESSETIFIIDKKGYFKDLNRAGLKLFDYNKEEIYKMNSLSLFECKTEANKFKKAIKKTGNLIDVNARLVDKNKNSIQCLISVNIIYGTDQEIIGYQGMIKDIRKQKEIESIVIRTIIDTQEKERERFAQDLHDSLGQQLSGIKFQMEILKKTVKGTEKKATTILNKSNSELNNAILELRNVCFNLMPRTLEDFGLSYSINDLCRKISATSKITFDIKIKEAEPIIDKTMKVAVFRIVQEFINNSIKHGKAKKVAVHFMSNKEKLTLVLKDNGMGFDTKNITVFNGMGLKNVKSRVESYNGIVQISSVQGKGTSYNIVFPMKQSL